MPTVFSLFDWLDDLAPSFDVDGSCIDVLSTPTEFYNELLSLTKSAKRRIILSSLYLGTGELEGRLIDALQSALERCNVRDGGNWVYLRFLLDYSRGTRGQPNSCTMVQPLKNQFGDRVDLVLFHTPLLRGVLKNVLPGRWNEIVGVQHMKLYIFDDTLLISGANLSNDYFTNRQDRYMVIRNCPALAEFYASIVEAVSACSFHMEQDGSLCIYPSCLHHPCDGDKYLYCDMLKRRIEAVTEKWKTRQPPIGVPGDNQHSRVDTRIYTLLQMGPIGIHTEDIVNRQVLTSPFSYANSKDQPHRIDLASGYFNLPSVYSDLILQRSISNYRILMASPRANGFFNGRGVSGYIPAVYVYAARLFYRAMERLQQSHRITLFEYFREGWTFHAKGMWLTISNDDMPSVTLIGSTNYGYRSVHRDLESQIVIVTENSRLRQQLKTERDQLFTHILPIDSSTFRRADHNVPFWMLPGLVAARVLLSRIGTGTGTANRPLPVRRHFITPKHRNRISSNFQGRRRIASTSGPSASANGVTGASTRAQYRGLVDRSRVISEETAQWIPIYRFKGVQWAGALSRVKIIQTGLVVGMVPMFVYMYKENQVTATTTITAVSVGGLALVMLYLMSSMLRRCIGVISIGKDQMEIRIGYLTFWGFRRNVVIPIDDIVPLDECNRELSTKNKLPPYLRVRRYSDPKFHLYLPLKWEEIVDQQLFQGVFGELPCAGKKE